MRSGSDFLQSTKMVQSTVECRASVPPIHMVSSSGWATTTNAFASLCIVGSMLLSILFYKPRGRLHFPALANVKHHFASQFVAYLDFRNIVFFAVASVGKDMGSELAQFLANAHIGRVWRVAGNNYPVN